MADSPADDVRMLVLDADGVLTDGSILLDNHANEFKRFSSRDGFGIRLWERMGFSTAIITGRAGEALLHRCREVGIVHVIQGAKDKSASLDELCAQTAATPGQMAYLGDDWPDLAAMRRVAYPMAVRDAEPAVTAAAAFVTPRPGGRGAVRDAVEHLLAAKGLLHRALALYDPAHNSRATPPPR